MPAFDGVNAPVFKMQFFYNGIYNDVSRTDLRSVDLTRGRTRPDQRINAGQLIITLDNQSGVYDPDNSSSIYYISGQTALRAGLKARLVATWSSVSYVLFLGTLETTALDAGFDAVATMTFVDAISDLGKFTAPPLKTAAFSGETTATRVGRMLTLGSFTGSRSLTGSVVLGSTTQDAPLMDLINQCEDAEAGCFYISRTGVATLVNLASKFSRPTQLSFDDQRVTNTVEYSQIITTPGTYQLVNACIVEYKPKNKKGFSNLMTSKNSVTKFGQKLFKTTTEMLSTTSANKLATYYATRNANPKTLVQEISFEAFALDSLYPDLLETEIQDLCIVKRVTVDGRSQTFNLVIEGLKYAMTPSEFQVTFYTSPVDATRITLP